MALTNFIDGSTKVISTWLNGVDVLWQTVFGGATTAAQARTALGVSATGADTSYPLKSNNLSDVTAATARTNLGVAASGANTDITSLNAPALGAATATTATPSSDNTTKVATTAFVQSAIAASSGAGTDINFFLAARGVI
jgi:hypothetical protein